jgi:uncharacterized protein HemY
MAVRILMLVAVLLGDPLPPSPYEGLLEELLRFVGVAVLCLIVGAAVMLTVLYLIQWLLTDLTATWLRTTWIGLGVLFFVMVVVPGALLIYQYSSIGD